MQLKISVIMPVYNRSSTVQRALDSLLAQSFSHFEVLIIDDGSTDHSVALIEPYLQDVRFRLLRLVENSGVNKARNAGLANISQDSHWVTFLDSDDEFVPDALANMVAAVQEAPHIADFCFAVRYADGRSGSSLQTKLTEYNTQSLLDADVRPLGEWVHCIRADLVRQGTFAYETSIRNGFEAIAYLRLARTTAVRYVQSVVRVYHLDVDGLTRIRRKTVAKAQDEIIGYRSFINEFGEVLRENNVREYALLNCVLAKTYLEVGQLINGLRLTGHCWLVRPLEPRIYRNVLMAVPVLLLKLCRKKLVADA